MSVRMLLCYCSLCHNRWVTAATVKTNFEEQLWVRLPATPPPPSPTENSEKQFANDLRKREELNQVKKLASGHQTLQVLPKIRFQRRPTPTALFSNPRVLKRNEELLGKLSAIEVQRPILTFCSPVEQSKTISVSPDPLSTTRCHGCAATWYIESTALLLSSLKPTGEPPKSTSSGTSSICVAICGAAVASGDSHGIGRGGASGGREMPKSQSVWPRPAELFFEQREERGRGRRSPLFARLRAALAPPPWPWLSSVPWERCGALLLPGPRRSIAVHAAKQHAVVTLFAAIRLPWRDGHP